MVSKRIKEDWSSYPGFHSFVPTYLQSWVKKIFTEEDETYISMMITYIAYKNSDKSLDRIRETICMDAYENIEEIDYVKVIKSRNKVLF